MKNSIFEKRRRRKRSWPRLGKQYCVSLFAGTNFHEAKHVNQTPSSTLLPFPDKGIDNLILLCKRRATGTSLAAVFYNQNRSGETGADKYCPASTVRLSICITTSSFPQWYLSLISSHLLSSALYCNSSKNQILQSLHHLLPANISDFFNSINRFPKMEKKRWVMLGKGPNPLTDHLSFE